MRPEDNYLLRLGFAHYRFQYVEWAVIYALHGATQEDVGDLATRTPRQLSNELIAAWQEHVELEPLARRYAELVTEREHLVHSHPATLRLDDGTSKQRLHRYDVRHRTRPTTIKWITSQWLDEFITAAEALSRDLP